MQTLFVRPTVGAIQWCREFKNSATLQENLLTNCSWELYNSNHPAFLCFFSPTRNVYAVWRSYLEGTVQVSQSRLNVCDNYKSQVSEPAKTVRLYKEQQLKKVSECVDCGS